MKSDNTQRLVAALGLTFGSIIMTVPAPAQAATTGSGCHAYNGDPRAGVSTPGRLILEARCVTVSGIVGCIHTSADDGDTHMSLLPDAGSKKYLTSANKVWACGTDPRPRLVIEILPQHCTVKPTNCADLGHFTSPKAPLNNQRVTIKGPWVLDTSPYHGATQWGEIHPAQSITTY